MFCIGYGDLVPRTTLGRFYASLWIMLSVLLFSWFTATLTAAESAEVIGRKDVKGMRIGVYAGTPAYELAYSLGAHCVVMDNLPNARTQFHFENVDGYVMDNLRVLFLSDILDSLNLEVQWFYQHPIVHGIGALNINPDLANCMLRKAFAMYYNILETLTHSTRPLKHQEVGKSTIDKNFGCFSSSIQKGLYFQLSISGFILLCHYGSCWLVKFWKKYQEFTTWDRKTAKTRDNEIVNQQNMADGTQPRGRQEIFSGFADPMNGKRWEGYGLGLSKESINLESTAPVKWSGTQYSFTKTSFRV